MARAHYVSTELTADELRALDDGQDWYSADDDNVSLGGYIDPDAPEGAYLDLYVDDAAHDNWIRFFVLPASIRARLMADLADAQAHANA
jgi:hypothetical protein